MRAIFAKKKKLFLKNKQKQIIQPGYWAAILSGMKPTFNFKLDKFNFLVLGARQEEKRLKKKLRISRTEKKCRKKALKVLSKKRNGIKGIRKFKLGKKILNLENLDTNFKQCKQLIIRVGKKVLQSALNSISTFVKQFIFCSVH